MGKKNFNYIILGITIFASLVLTFVFKETITTSETYIILPIWFLCSEIGFDYFKEHTQYKNTTSIIIFTSIMAFIVTSIITVVFVQLNIFQAIEYFTLFASIAGVLFTYQQDFIKEEK